MIVGKKPAQQGMVEAKVGDIAGLCPCSGRGRAPYKQDFEKVPLGAVPAGWVNTPGKYSVVELDRARRQEVEGALQAEQQRSAATGQGNRLHDHAGLQQAIRFSPM